MVVDLGKKKKVVCLLFVNQAVCGWYFLRETLRPDGWCAGRRAADGQPPLGLPAPAAGGEERTGDEGRLPGGRRGN